MLFVWIAFAPHRAGADVFRVPSNATGYVDSPSKWRFNAGDDPKNGAATIDDAMWGEVSTRLEKSRVPSAWNGAGWFRTRVHVAHDGVYVLRVRQRGSSEVWLDGRLVAVFGTPDEPRATGRTLVTLRADAEHVLAIHYVNRDVDGYHRISSFGGFEVSLSRGIAAMGEEIRTARTSSGYLWFFTGIFLAFATLHLLLFTFTPEIRENLYFSLLCITVAVLAFFLFYRDQMVDPRVLFVAERSMNVAGLGMGFCLLRYVYGIFRKRLPRFLWIYSAVAVPVAIWSWPNAGAAMFFVFLLMLAAMIESSRFVVVALIRRLSGARIVGAGILAVGAGFGVGLLANLGVIPHSRITATLVPLGSIVVQLAMMSFYISRQFAITNQQLRVKLVEVQQLSEQQLESERRQQQEQAERRLLEAEYQRKVEELEEARQLQLSMLPARMPKVPQLDIAARMDTATEVGGDYYDFELGDDGTLTIAVGDATGHGMRAGTMVTAAKALFGIFCHDRDLSGTLARSTLALKRMNLRKLAMALILAQYRDGALRITAAGMPPVCIHRAASGEVEQIDLPGMPLGAVARFPYGSQIVQLQPGDAVLFMTDGFPERLGREDELFGYDRAIDVFRNAAAGDAAEIIGSLHHAAEQWAEGRAADDDVTFVVLKMRVA